MKNSKEILILLFGLLITINFSYAQGQGQGQGQGLLNNTGCENGKGFTIGQGHLKGKSAVECPECCIQNVVDAVYETILITGRGTPIGHQITGADTFDVFVDLGGDGDCDIVYHIIWTGDACSLFNFAQESLPSPC